MLGATLKWTLCVNREGEFSWTFGTLWRRDEGGHATVWLKYNISKEESDIDDWVAAGSFWNVV